MVDDILCEWNMMAKFFVDSVEFLGSAKECGLRQLRQRDLWKYGNRSQGTIFGIVYVVDEDSSDTGDVT